MAFLIIFHFSFFIFHSHAQEPQTRATQPTTAPSDNPFPAMKKAFADLANPDGQVRDDAFVWLMGLNPTDLPALRKLVRQSLPLAPEQLMALPQIVMHVYLTGETYDVVPDAGFLGIFMPSSAVESGECVVVDRRMPGFVGERALREGDVILGVVEHPTLEFHKGSELSDAMKPFKAGDVVHLQVLRQGKVQRITARLDPKPAEAEPGTREAIEAFNASRRARAEQYWQEHFADLLETPQAQ
ncbi:MAG TPA: hypothetical protein VH370_12515 [Humisphaera sp.]|nr:hypothetical protein [Humisphaera sp.]